MSITSWSVGFECQFLQLNCKWTCKHVWIVPGTCCTSAESPQNCKGGKKRQAAQKLSSTGSTHQHSSTSVYLGLLNTDANINDLSLGLSLTGIAVRSITKYQYVIFHTGISNGERANLTRLVLSYTEAHFCDQIFVGKLSPRFTSALCSTALKSQNFIKTLMNFCWPLPTFVTCWHVAEMLQQFVHFCSFLFIFV